MAKTYAQFKNEYLGKAVDIDGFYQAQCWDGAMAFSKWLGYPVFNCTVTGYAQDIWTQRKYSGILNYYDEVTVMQPGDIVVFKQTSVTPYSHIAIFDSDAGNGYGNFLGQNQGGANGAFNIVALPYSATYDTAFRPKCLGGAATNTGTSTNGSKLPAGFTAQKAKFTVTVDAINVRDKANTSGKVVATYKKGESVTYDCYKADKNGYVWISYIGGTGQRRYMVCGESKNYANVKPYGTFA